MIKFGHDGRSDGRTGERKAECMACEEMLADVLDQTLSEADQAWFDRHIGLCGECSRRLAEAQRGAAWLELLKSPRPEPSAELMERILAATSAAGESAVPRLQPAMSAHVLSVPPARVLPFRMPLPRFRTPWLEPRLAMTAAMAFFSVALTLNLTGVKLDRLHAGDLNPANLKRSYYEANAEVSRYYENLRVVRVMESRVEDMRQAVDESDEPRPQAAPEAVPAPKAAPNDRDNNRDKDRDKDRNKPKPTPQDGHGVSRREMPLADPRARMGQPGRSVTIRATEGGLA